jgi:hypothetical protein
MLVAQNEDFPSLHDRLQEVVSGPKLVPELPDGIDRRIDGPLEISLGVPNHVGDLRKGCLAYHDQVEIAALALFSPRHRAMDEGNRNAAAQGVERPANARRPAEGLRDNAAQLLEDRAGRIGLKVDMTPTILAADDAGGSEEFHLTLHLTHSQAGEFHDLAQIEGFIRMGIQKSEDALSSPGEERHGERISQKGSARTHNAYKCTMNEYYCTSYRCVCAKGITLSELVRAAIDERYEQALSTERPLDVAAILARLDAEYPIAAKDLAPRGHDVHERRQAARAIRKVLCKRRRRR